MGTPTSSAQQATFQSKLEPKPVVAAPIAPPVATTPAAPPKPDTEKSSKVLENNIDQFNSSLEDGTGLVKGQITELSRSFEALRGFGDNMPTLLDSMQSGNNSENGFRLAPHNVLALSQLAMLSPHLAHGPGARGSP